VLWIFIILKNSSPWLDSNLRLLGPVASTLTTTPPRQLKESILKVEGQCDAHSIKKEKKKLHIWEVTLCSTDLV
jgi:hypothetical protein